jgi:hypothetical protein
MTGVSCYNINTGLHMQEGGDRDYGFVDGYTLSISGSGSSDN